MSNITKYKIENTVKKELEDVLNSLLNICKINQIPMYATVAAENNEKATEYLTVVCNPASRDIILLNDEIRKHMLIGGGFEIAADSEDKSDTMQTEYVIIATDSGEKGEPETESKPSQKKGQGFEYIIIARTSEECKKIENIISVKEKKPKTKEKDEDKDEKVLGKGYEEIELNEDRIKKHIQVENGADVVLPREAVVFDPFGLIDKINI